MLNCSLALRVSLRVGSGLGAVASKVDCVTIHLMTLLPQLLFLLPQLPFLQNSTCKPFQQYNAVEHASSLLLYVLAQSRLHRS